MEMEQRQETNQVQGSMLEVPEVVPGTASVDFPEIADFLRNMKMKSGLFGFQKEDVYEKMQQLNKMYQTRAQQMREQNRGQLKQMKKQQQEELEELKGRLAAEQQAAYEKMQEEIARARVEIRRELEAQMKEKAEQQNRELVMIGEELERLNERFALLKNKVKDLTDERQAGKAE